ncbi:MAG: tetratricopeptide repeat protein [Planctomycetota bacterium]|nr:tetratricopeptide repeat protein [Planctomycetota bacterium]
MKESFLSRFTPSLLSHETLEAIFVQREALAKKLVEGIRESAESENKHYYLLVGPRGMGKTHIVSLVYHRVCKDAGIRDKLLIAWLREEEWGIASFLDFMLALLRTLVEEHSYDDLADRYHALFELKPEEAELEAEKLLRDAVGDKTLLVITENLDETFKGLEQTGQEKLRAYIQNNAFFVILATSQSLFNGVSERTSPFYAFFETHQLHEFSFEDVISMLRSIASHEGDEELALLLSTPRGRARVRAVHHLAAGNPRVYVIFAQFLTCESLNRLVQPLMQTLDDLTPYYQGRMNYLTPQQRKIVEFMCEQRHAVSVSEIARRNFLTHQTTSGQLKKLRELGYAQAHQAGRESYYELREPLMRISLEVKKLRGEPIRLLVQFLQLWYSRAELTKRLESLEPQAECERRYLAHALEAREQASEDPPVAACLHDYSKHQKEGGFKDALDIAEELIEIRNCPSDWYRKAKCLQKLGRDDEAERCKKNALELEPTDAASWRDRAQVLTNEEGRHEEALAACGKALELAPKYTLAWRTRAVCLARLERYEEALASIERVLEFNPKDSLAWRNHAVGLEQLKRYEEALASYAKALEIDPKDAVAWRMRALPLYQLERHQEALDSCDKALELDPKDALAWRRRADPLEQLLRYEEALASYDEALELDPKDVVAWRYRAFPLGCLDRFEEAVDAYDKALELDPKNALTWHFRAGPLVHLQRYEEALASYDRALELDPTSVATWRCRTIPLERLERYEEELASFDKALELDPNDAASLMCRAISLERLERFEEAQDSYDKALELDPQDADGWNYRAYLLYGRGQLEESFASLDRAVQLAPQDPGAWSNRGVALSALGRQDEALASFDKALELYSAERDADSVHFQERSNRAVALMLMGRWDEGLGALDDALDRLAVADDEDSAEVAIVRNMLIRTRDVPTWRRHIAVWIELFQKHDVLAALGQGIVHSIRRLTIPWITNDAARAWRDVWLDLGSAHKELALPLRLLNTAVEYRAKPDKRVLLRLPVEERGLLEPLLRVPKSEQTT